MKFELNEKEVQNFNTFKDAQLLKYRREGAYEFRFIPTGVAYAIVVVNRQSKDECNISDFDSW